MAILPEIFKELVPLIIEKSEALINKNITKGLKLAIEIYLTTLMSIKKLPVLFAEITITSGRNFKSEKMFTTSLYVVTS